MSTRNVRHVNAATMRQITDQHIIHVSMNLRVNSHSPCTTDLSFTPDENRSETKQFNTDRFDPIRKREFLTIETFSVNTFCLSRNGILWACVNYKQSLASYVCGWNSCDIAILYFLWPALFFGAKMFTKSYASVAACNRLLTPCDAV